MSNMKNVVVVVDDNRDTLNFISHYLVDFEFEVYTAQDSAEAWNQIRQHGVDILLVDLRLGNENGLNLARAVLSQHQIPIIMISAVSDDVEKVLGLETVLNDYIEKPVVPRVLLAKIRAVLRSAAAFNQRSTAEEHGTPSLPEDDKINFGDFALNLEQRNLARTSGELIELTNTEFRLLELLVTNKNEVFSRQDILDNLGLDSSNHMMRNIDVLVLRLRRKIEKSPSTPVFLQTRRNKGYVFCIE